MNNKLYFKLVLTVLITILCTPISYAQPPGMGWGNPVFEDEFNGNSIDTNKWRVRNEANTLYSADMASVSNGILTLKNDMVGGDDAAARKGVWMDSKQLFGNGADFPKYGYFEAEIRINLQDINFNWIGGKIWPTWWIWGGNYRNGGPAPSATEIDIMEYSRWTNFKADNNATSSHHYFNQDTINGKKKFAVTDKNSPRDEFNWHRWGVLWTPTEITFYYDGVPFGTSDQPGDAAADIVPSKLIFSSAPHVVTHPDTPPIYAPKASDILPTFQVKWVKVWQGGNPSSGANASFDFGTSNSPLQTGYTKITQSSSNWTNTSGLDSRLRSTGPNNLNRDFIFSTQTKTFEHTLPNGTYDVTVTFGDRDYARNGQAVKAEGQTKASNINTNANQFVNKSFQTTVSDGKLSLEFSTTSGVWCVTRVTVAPASGGNQVAGSYDFGTNNSPLLSGYSRITPTSSNWTNTTSIDSRDRGTGPNNLNRDFIFSTNAKTFEHTTGNGTYDVTVTFGDRDYARNGQAVKSEGQTVISSFNTAANQFRNATFQTTVNDGKLSLEFSTASGVWCVTRVVITPTSSAKSITETSSKNIAIYPNPILSGSILTIASVDTITSINVFDITGSQVYAGNSNEISIDLNSGLYLVQINTTEGNSTKKLLVK